MDKKLFTNSKWEQTACYCRAQRVGDRIIIAGTTAVNDGQVIAPYDAYHQALYIFDIMDQCLTELGASMADVVLTRMYVTDIDFWEGIAKAHGQYFNDICPAATLVEVTSLILPGLVIEIEAEAMIRKKER